VKPVINYFNEKFKDVYVIEENIAIDESLMKLRDTCLVNNTIPRKGRDLRLNLINCASQHRASAIIVKYIQEKIK
jgi:hypothetical protein